MTEKEIEGFKCPGCGVSLNVLLIKEDYKEDKATASIPRTAEELEGLCLLMLLQI